MRNRSTKRALGSMLMAFESFVVFFATLLAFGLKVADGPTVWIVGLALSFCLILTPGLLGRKGSYAWGWALQIIVVLLGLWLPLMYLIGGIFLALWAWAMVAGGTIDKARAALDKQYRAAESNDSTKEN